jgi:hypothetical protein
MRCLFPCACDLDVIGSSFAAMSILTAKANVPQFESLLVRHVDFIGMPTRAQQYHHITGWQSVSSSRCSSPRQRATFCMYMYVCLCTHHILLTGDKGGGQEAAWNEPWPCRPDRGRPVGGVSVFIHACTDRHSVGELDLGEAFARHADKVVLLLMCRTCGLHHAARCSSVPD